MIMVQVLQGAGWLGRAPCASCGQIARAGDLHGKDDAACRQVVLVLNEAVVFDFFFVGQVVVLAVQVVHHPGGSGDY